MRKKQNDNGYGNGNGNKEYQFRRKSTPDLWRMKTNLSFS
jgi:hypothetical protein